MAEILGFITHYGTWNCQALSVRLPPRVWSPGGPSRQGHCWTLPGQGFPFPNPLGPFLARIKGWVVPPDHLSPRPHPLAWSPLSREHGRKCSPEGSTPGAWSVTSSPHTLLPQVGAMPGGAGPPARHPPYILPAPCLPGLPPALPTTQAASLDLQSPPGPPLPFRRGTTPQVPGLRAQASPHQRFCGSSTGLSSLQGLK